tara:strand:+ start:397 stop:606 length:210 start_codon:yes stop_codon:yes gene_type:complete
MVILFVNSAKMMIVREYKDQIKRNILRKIKLQQKCKMKNQYILIKRYDDEIERLTEELDYWYQIEENIQ